MSIRQKSIALCAMNWPIFSLNFVRVGAGFFRMARSGNRRVAIWKSRMKSAVIISRFRQDDTQRVSFTGAQIADGNFRASGRYAVRLRAWPAVARTMEVNSTRGFD